MQLKSAQTEHKIKGIAELQNNKKCQRVTAISLSISQPGVLSKLGLIKPNGSCSGWDLIPAKHLLWIIRLCSKSVFTAKEIAFKSVKCFWTADKDNKLAGASINIDL